jgi:truncated hemoglobin YjbI
MALPLFERLGGFARVRLIIAAFYDQVLETESLGAYFARADTRRLIDHQTKFMAQLMGAGRWRSGTTCSGAPMPGSASPASTFA